MKKLDLKEYRSGSIEAELALKINEIIAVLETEKECLGCNTLPVDNPFHNENKKVEQYQCRSYIKDGELIDCKCGKCF